MNHRPGLTRQMSRRQLLKYSGMAGAAIAGSSFLSACGDDSGGGAQSTGGTLIHGATGGGPQDTLDAHQPVTNPDIARVCNLYEPLLFWNNNYEIEPGLAESIEADSEGTTWTIRMRPGVTFHNGKNVTAEDAWFSISRVADPDAPLSAGGQLSQIIDFDSTKVVDDQTLQLVLNTPYAVIDMLLAEYTLGIVPSDYDPANPVGTGPFAYSSFTPGSTSTFNKYADYWGDAAFVDELIIQDFADDNAKVNALQAGQLHTIDNLPYNLIETIEAAGGGALVSDTGAWVPFTMRVDQEAFADNKVRQAFRLIVDRNQMIEQTLSGYGQLGNDMYAPFDPGYASDFPQREQDIEQAKSLLKEAGQEGLQVELFTGDDIGSVAPASANLFAEQAKAAGVDVRVTKKPTFYDDDYLSYTFAQDFWNTRNYIPQAAVCALPSGTYNETHFDNDDFTDLINTAAATVDEEKRTTLMQDAQKIEYDEGGYIIWGFRQQVDGYSAAVQGLEASKYLPLGSYNFSKLSLD